MADHRNMPFPPRLDLVTMKVADLAVLADYFDALSAAALGVLNQPRCLGAAADYADDYWNHHLLGMSDAIIAEIESRTPSDEDEAKLRAQVLLRHLSVGDNFEKMAAIAEAVTTAFSADLVTQG